MSIEALPDDYFDGVLVDSTPCIERQMSSWAARHNLEEVYLAAAAQLGVDPRRCVVVEDAPAGISAARAAGMVVLALLGTHAAHQLRQAHAVIEQFAHLYVETLPVHADARLRIHLHPLQPGVRRASYGEAWLNEELLALYNVDREERVYQPRMGTPEYTSMRERDTQRRLRAAAIVSTLEAPEAADLYHAAQLFQHGDDPEDAWRAYELAREAAERGDERARWLTAAAYDRWLVYQGKPQKYGTAFFCSFALTKR